MGCIRVAGYPGLLDLDWREMTPTSARSKPKPHTAHPQCSPLLTLTTPPNIEQRHVLKPTRRLGKVLHSALQTGDYVIADMHGPGLSPLLPEAVAEAEQHQGWGYTPEGEEGGVDGEPPLPPVVSGASMWDWSGAGLAGGGGEGEAGAATTVVTVVDGEKEGK